jgi:hypothetical protein
MTLVAGLARMTTAPTHEEFVETLVGRISSLAKTMTLLGRSRWAGATIGDLLREELAAYLPDADQGHDIRMAGPEVVLGVDAAQQLSIALHELTTNSAKYGALSVHGGVLDLLWLVADGTVTITLAGTWRAAAARRADAGRLRQLPDPFDDRAAAWRVRRHGMGTGWAVLPAQLPPGRGLSRPARPLAGGVQRVKFFLRTFRAKGDR